jgi:hypothetical protein
MAFNFKLSQAAAKALSERQGCKWAHGTDVSFKKLNTSEYDRINTITTILSVFNPGDRIYVKGSTTSDINTGTTVRARTALTLDIDGGAFGADEAAGDAVTIFCSDGGSFKEVFNSGSLYLYGGAQRARPEDLTTESPIAVFPNILFAASTWAGTPDFKESLALASDYTSSALKSGTVTWFSLCRNGHIVNLASTTAIRCDGTVGQAGNYDLFIPDGVTVTFGDVMELTTSVVFRLNTA